MKPVTNEIAYNIRNLRFGLNNIIKINRSLACSMEWKTIRPINENLNICKAAINEPIMKYYTAIKQYNDSTKIMGTWNL